MRVGTEKSWGAQRAFVFCVDDHWRPNLPGGTAGGGNCVPGTGGWVPGKPGVPGAPGAPGAPVGRREPVGCCQMGWTELLATLMMRVMSSCGFTDRLLSANFRVTMTILGRRL